MYNCALDNLLLFLVFVCASTMAGLTPIDSSSKIELQGTTEKTDESEKKMTVIENWSITQESIMGIYHKRGPTMIEKLLKFIPLSYIPLSGSSVMVARKNRESTTRDKELIKNDNCESVPASQTCELDIKESTEKEEVRQCDAVTDTVLKLQTDTKRVS